MIEELRTEARMLVEKLGKVVNNIESLQIEKQEIDAEIRKLQKQIFEGSGTVIEDKRDTDTADHIYQMFCEDGGLERDYFQDAWDAYEDEFGTIKIASKVSDLIHEAIRFAITQYQAEE
jgi:gamma-glutamyl phosphate reductase